jgi:hypothetical protein
MMRLLDQTFAQINQQPMLVARAQVPWQTVAAASTARPVIAGFAFNNNSLPAPQQQYASIAPRGEVDEETAESRPDQDEIAKLIQNAPPRPRVGVQGTPQQPNLTSPPPQLRTSAPPPSSPQTSVAMLPPTAQRPQPQTNFAAAPPAAPRQQPSAAPPITPKAQPNIAAATPPKPQPVQVALLSAPAQVKLPDVRPIPAPIQPQVQAQANIPNVIPLPRDNAVPVTLASYQPQSLPDVMPIPRASVADDRMAAAVPSTFKVTTAPGTTTAKIAKAASTSGAAHGWTIQIGAFGDIPTARAQLAAYAQKSMEALAHAERIIVPFQGSGGKTMYRARFGTFAEQEARSLCASMTKLGESCFASTLAH